MSKKKAHFSDFCPIETDENTTALEKYVYQEAKHYLDETAILACPSTDNKHIRNVLKKGEEITPYIIKLTKKQLELGSQGMYMHFCLIVLQKMYGSAFSGYISPDVAAKYYIKQYEHGILGNHEPTTEQTISFFKDFNESIR